MQFDAKPDSHEVGRAIQIHSSLAKIDPSWEKRIKSSECAGRRIPVAAGKCRPDAQLWPQKNRAQIVRGVCSDAPGSYVCIPEGTPLIHRFPVVVQRASRSPESCPRRVPYLLRAAAVEGRSLLVNSEIIQVDVPATRSGQRSHGVNSPEHNAVVRRIVENIQVVDNWPGSKSI